MYYENFKDLCDINKVKPADITKATGITSATFTSWKKGDYTPKQAKLQQIADFFNVSINVLMGKPETTHEEIRDNHQTHQLVNDFLKLDLDDRRTILLMVQALLDNQKYKKAENEVG